MNKGFEDRELQDLVNTGAIDQIEANQVSAVKQIIQQGTENDELQILVNSGALAQVSESISRCTGKYRTTRC